MNFPTGINSYRSLSTLFMLNTLVSFQKFILNGNNSIELCRLLNRNWDHEPMNRLKVKCLRKIEGFNFKSHMRASGFTLLRSPILGRNDRTLLLDFQLCSNTDQLMNYVVLWQFFRILFKLVSFLIRKEISLFILVFIKSIFHHFVQVMTRYY